MKKDRRTLYILLGILLGIISATIVLVVQLDKSPDMLNTADGTNNTYELTDANETLNNAAELLSKKELVKAEKLLDLAIKKHPANSNLWLMLGTVYYRQEKYAQAEKAFRHLLRRNPDNAAGLNNLSETLSKLKRYDEAKSMINQALNLAPKNGAILLNAANLYASLHEDTQALKFLKQALDCGVQPETVSLYIDLVRLLERPEFMNYYKRKRSEKKI